jgi:hypothetical protein
MNEFYITIGFLKSLFDQDTAVHTTLHGSDFTDINKKNIFPIAHIQVLNSSIKNGIVNFNFEIVTVDQRNMSKSIVTDKWNGNDNELDNLNTCHAILNRLIGNLTKKNNEFKIQLINEPTLEPIIFEFSNILDGWRTEIELSIPNNKINVC